MTATTTSTANEVKQWDATFFAEYVRDNEMGPYMGTDANACIQLNEMLTKKPGDAVTISLIGKLNGANVGAGKLEDSEEALDNYGHQITLTVVRNAVVINNFEEQSSAIDLRNGGKIQLQNWSMDLLRNDILEALHSVNGVNYGTATAGAHDTNNTDNDDRNLFVGQGAGSGDHTADLAALATTDIMSASVVSLARRKARTADPHIRPIRVNGSEEWFVMFCDPYAFRDLKDDSTIAQANREAWQRGKDNPLFRAGDIIYDGVICREVPEIGNLIDTATTGPWGAGATADSLKTGGTGGIRVGVSFLCGAQAVGVAWGKRTKSTTDTRDYGFLNGIGIEEYRGVEKLLYTGSGTNAADHGVVTIYAAAAMD